MKKVCDSNFLRDPDLAIFLDATRSNQIVLPDVVMVEMHKKNALLTATKSTEQLVRRSGQVIVLKTFDRIYGYDIRSAAGARAMTDQAQTQTFDEYCQLLRQARGIPAAEQQIAESEARAAEQIALIAKDSAHLQPIFKRINARFTLAELADCVGEFPMAQQPKRSCLTSCSTSPAHSS